MRVNKNRLYERLHEYIDLTTSKPARDPEDIQILALCISPARVPEDPDPVSLHLARSVSASRQPEIQKIQIPALCISQDPVSLHLARSLSASRQPEFQKIQIPCLCISPDPSLQLASQRSRRSRSRLSASRQISLCISPARVPEDPDPVSLHLASQRSRRSRSRLSASRQPEIQKIQIPCLCIFVETSMEVEPSKRKRPRENSAKSESPTPCFNCGYLTDDQAIIMRSIGERVQRAVRLPSCPFQVANQATPEQCVELFEEASYAEGGLPNGRPLV